METVEVKSWPECERVLLERARNLSPPAGAQDGWHSDVLFRGQGSDAWLLETTFDRYPAKSTSLAEYYRSVAIAQTQVETFTGQRWDPVDVNRLMYALREYDFLRIKAIPHAELLVYMRHHGFPSPLLDWTRSPYVAAYFACCRPTSEKVAIFLYQEHQGRGKLGSSDAAQIVTIGPNIRSHSRHFVQQAEYTVCVEYLDGEWRIAHHEAVFQQETPHQDSLCKVTMPASEAEIAMRAMDHMNISAHSLFGSEEALLETLAWRFLRNGG